VVVQTKVQARYARGVQGQQPRAFVVVQTKVQARYARGVQGQQLRADRADVIFGEVQAPHVVAKDRHDSCQIIILDM
jgi:hypothetical protein